MACNFLIIEDDFIIQMFLENIIANLGHQIVGIADNSNDGLKLIELNKPDIILMDIGISGKLDGIETAKIVNEKHNIPIVFITGNSDVATIKRANKTNPLYIINKPIDEDRLKKEIEMFCAKIEALKLPKEK